VRRYRLHLFVACALAAALLTELPVGLRNALVDLRFRWFPCAATGDIVVVAIDSPSIEQIGTWPWPRQLHAELIGRLERAGASDIAFDIDFSAPSTPEPDRALAEALRAAGGSVVLPHFKQPVNTADGIHVNRPLPQLAAESWPSIVNLALETSGLVRRYPLGEVLDGAFLPSIGAMLAGRYEPREEPFWIDFGIRPESIPTVSYVDVLRGDPAVMQRLAGKKVIIGGTALELGDRFSVPNGRVLSGPLLQALAVESMLQGRALRSASGLVTLAGAALVAAFMLLLWRRLPALPRIGVLVGLSIAAELVAMLLHARMPIILDTSLVHLAVGAYLIAVALDEIDLRGLLGRIAEKRFQRIAMSVGDGLVCADEKGLITVWNGGAAAIFGYGSKEAIGEPFDRICTTGFDVSKSAFSIRGLPSAALQAPGGHVMELAGRRKNGELFPLEACFSGWQGADGFQYGAVLRDISVRKREAERIRHLAEYDTLTGLANRNTLGSELDARLSGARTGQSEVALLVIGLDKFQLVNSMLGHAYGDQVLCAVAARLSALAKPGDMVARLSGDEFAIVTSGAAAGSGAQALSEQACLAFGEAPLFVGGRRQATRVSVGTAVYPDNCTTAEELLANAHLALSRAKAFRRGGHVAFERGIREEIESRLKLEAELKLALQREEFEIFYQPQVGLADARLQGAEALIRWRHPERGLLSPDAFMPVVNTTPMSDDVALWVMEAACRQASAWQQAGHAVRIGVNLGPSQLQAGDLASTVAMVLASTGLSPALLELEVTENILLAEDDKVVETFARIRAQGIRIVFDDFGTGYASLSYLKKFPLDGIKIDKSFVGQLRAGSDDAAIVDATISLSRQLGLSIIAEGIEDRGTADLLAHMGCREGQGYYFGRPMTAADFEQKFLTGAGTSPAAVELTSTAA
jgi:diguanylate cyclase (GGDEF)-like protein/PAS domain S-box-containing protein